MPPGTLFVVATPIGNLADLSRRAEDTLRLVSRILAEDTRRTRGLLSSLGVTGTPVDRFDAHADERDVARVLAHLEAGERIALVTDAGTPAVSDPGASLVRAAAAAGAAIVPIPGPSAVVTALAGAGFAETAFLFLGFLPRSGREREEAVARICATREVIVLFEAGNRLAETLAELARVAPNREAVVGRELTKAHEEFARGTIAELSAREEWRGEITLVLGPSSGAAEAEASDADIDLWLDEEIAKGASTRDAAAIAAARSGRAKRDVYARAIARTRARSLRLHRRRDELRDGHAA
jgi:16S rRNA (cytidine1402-2'-O)-methyltransferase